eukprot:scaffold3767_cov116-Skeletonema_menzelii.AAC.8
MARLSQPSLAPPYLHCAFTRRRDKLLIYGMAELQSQSSGDVAVPIRRSARGLPISSTFESGGDDSLSYATVDFPSSSAAYWDYKFTCAPVRTRTRAAGSSKWMLGWAGLGSLELAVYLLES